MLSMSGVKTGWRKAATTQITTVTTTSNRCREGGEKNHTTEATALPASVKAIMFVSLPICLWFDLVGSAASISLPRAVRLQPTEHSAGTLQLNGPSSL